MLVVSLPSQGHVTACWVPVHFVPFCPRIVNPSNVSLQSNQECRSLMHMRLKSQYWDGVNGENASTDSDEADRITTHPLKRPARNLRLFPERQASHTSHRSPSKTKAQPPRSPTNTHTPREALSSCSRQSAQTAFDCTPTAIMGRLTLVREYLAGRKAPTGRCGAGQWPYMGL